MNAGRMGILFKCLCLGTSTWLTAASAFAEQVPTGSPAPTDELQVKRAILSLGAIDYTNREAATFLLLEIGERAVPSLKTAAESADPEVRFRARMVLNDISLGVTRSTPPEIRDFLRRFSDADSVEKAFVVDSIRERDVRFALTMLAIYLRTDAKERWRQQFVTSLRLLLNDKQTKKQDFTVLAENILQTDDESLHSVLFSLLASADRRDDGKQMYLNAMQRDPSRLVLLRYTLKLLRETRNYDQVVSLVEERIRNKGTLTIDVVETALFVCENNLNSSERATGLYDKLIELNPKKAEVHYGQADNYHGRGMYKEAVEEYTKALDLGYDTPLLIYQNRAYCYRELSVWDKGIKDMTKVIELNPADRGAYLERGRMFVEQGTLKEAIADFDKFLKFEPRQSSERLVWDEAQKTRDTLLRKMQAETSGNGKGVTSAPLERK